MTYHSNRPLAVFSGHGQRVGETHTLSGMNGEGIESKKLVAELNGKLVEDWNLPPVEVFIACDTRGHGSFQTRWDMESNSDHKVLGFPLGLNFLTYDERSKALVIPIDLMNRFGAGLNVLKNSGARRKHFDSIFSARKMTMKDWIKWVFYRELQSLKLKNQR